MKKPLLIVTLILSTVLTSQAQSKTGTGPNTGIQTSIVRFYPNPASSAITFDFQRSYDKGYSIQIYNFLGRKMLEQTNIADHTTINLTDYTRGVYIYKLFDKSGRVVETGKFQVSK